MRYPNLETSLNGAYGSKADLARFCKVSESQIGRIGRGESLPSIPLLKKIAKYHSVSIDFLLKVEIDTE